MMVPFLLPVIGSGWPYNQIDKKEILLVETCVEGVEREEGI